MGCGIEKLQLEKLERLEPALACYLIIAWRVLFLAMLGRACPEMPCDVVFDKADWQAVYIVTERKPPTLLRHHVSWRVMGQPKEI